jgi:hypothetical protein
MVVLRGWTQARDRVAFAVGLVSVLSAAVVTKADEPKRLLAMPLVARAGVDAAQLAVLSDFFTAEARRIPDYHVVTQADVEQMLTAEMRMQLVGCEGTSCLSEIAGALNADEILYGSVGRLGRKDLVLTISRIAPGQATALAGEAERLVTDNRDAMFDSISRLLKRLYSKYQPRSPRVKPMNGALLASMLAFIGAAFQYASLATVIAAPTLPGAPIIPTLVVLASSITCCASPLWLSWLQAWMADLMGSRRVAVWKPALAGYAAMAVSFAVGAVFQTVAFLVTGVGVAITLATYGAQYARSRTLPEAQSAAFRVLPLFLVPAAAIQVVMTGLLLSMPLVQACTVVWAGKVRSPDETAQFPRMFSPDDNVPAALGWLPLWLLGGKPGADESPLLESAPALATPTGH